MQFIHRVPLFWIMSVPVLVTCFPSSPPSISSFWPLQGPWEGGTNITIQVTRFKLKFEDFKRNIWVAGVPCTPFEEKYVPMESIVCAVKESNSLPDHEGPVEILIDGNRIVSEKNFKFVDPKIESIFPKKGSTNGYTRVTITGENLNAGTDIKICIEKEAKVFVKIDESIRYLNDEKFSYVKDPQDNKTGSDIDPVGYFSKNNQNFNSLCERRSNPITY